MRYLLTLFFASLTALSSLFCEGSSAAMAEHLARCPSVEETGRDSLGQNFCLIEATVSDNKETGHDGHDDCSGDCFGCCHHFTSLTAEEVLSPKNKTVLLSDHSDALSNVDLDGPFQPPKHQA